MASSQLDLGAAEAAGLLWWMGQGLQQGLGGQQYRGRDTLPGHHLLTCDGGERDIAISVIQGHHGTRGRRGCLRTCSRSLDHLLSTWCIR